MGWKNIKEHYRIGHAVQVTSEGICIGSPYIHNIIVIGLDGTIKKPYTDLRCNEDLQRYMAEFTADTAKLKELLSAPDTFKAALPVYTYAGGEILEKFCEEYGWPNITHDGCVMYENTFSKYKAKVVGWAKRNAEAEIKWRADRLAEILRQGAEIADGYETAKENLKKLKDNYPEEK